MKTSNLTIDGNIQIADLARALASIGCKISSGPSGEMRVTRGPKQPKDHEQGNPIGWNEEVGNIKREDSI